MKRKHFSGMLGCKPINGEFQISWKKTSEIKLVIPSKFRRCKDYRRSSYRLCESSEKRIHQNEEYKPMIIESKRKPPNEKSQMLLYLNI